MPPTADELIARYIEPGLTGPANARLADEGVHVWALIGYLRANGGDIGRVAADYALSREAVEAAIAYYEHYRAAIDARLALQASYFAAD
jgi:uncharacterized protein (DUF433 family)